MSLETKVHLKVKRWNRYTHLQGLCIHTNTICMTVVYFAIKALIHGVCMQHARIAIVPKKKELHIRLACCPAETLHEIATNTSRVTKKNGLVSEEICCHIIAKKQQSEIECDPSL